MTKREIRKLIAKGEIKETIEIMLSMAEKQGNGDVEMLLLLKSASFEQNEKSKKRGTINEDNYKMTLAQITYVLIDTLDGLEFEASSPTPQPEKIINKSISKSAPTPEPEPTKSKIILFLASNPSGTGKLQLEKEHSRITQELQDSGFLLKIKKDVSLSSFQKYILKEEPFIVHFSGHGEKSDAELKDAMSRGGLDIDEMESSNDSGIVLYKENLREAFVVGTDVIKRLFRGMVEIQNIAIDTVIFNSCYSEEQAKAVAEFVPNVIGTSWSVKDEAAIAFATSFYIGVADGRSVLQSVFLGITNATAYNEPAERFVLYQNGEKVEI